MVLYYWKDALEKVGIRDTDTAFASYESLVATIEKLQKAGHPYPLSLTTTYDPVNTHEAAYWIWTAGGDFVSEDQRQVVVNQPAAIKGLMKYFSLKPFISPKSFQTHSAEELFLRKEAAIQVAGSWLGIVGREKTPAWRDQLGICQLPGIGYVGGSSFVIWRYSSHPQEAFELVRFLSSQPIYFPASLHDHELPVRREAIGMPVTENNVFNRTYIQSLQSGKPFPTMRLWGAVEEKLINEIAKIWADRFSNPDEDLNSCLHKHLDPIVKRLNLTLGN
jgi:multiple sugar transport system substrate-binding protein